VPHAIALTLPKELGPIAKIQCSKRHSFILSKSGKVWVTGGVKEEKNSRLSQLKGDIMPKNNKE
jgi:alpha-tubulin suppressor-like RCC1 family protein